jgi:hypothetical protein
VTRRPFIPFTDSSPKSSGTEMFNTVLFQQETQFVLSGKSIKNKQETTKINIKPVQEMRGEQQKFSEVFVSFVLLRAES